MSPITCQEDNRLKAELIDVTNFANDLIPALNESLINITRETESAAFAIGNNLREIMKTGVQRPEVAKVTAELMTSLQFQDITRQEIEDVMNHLVILKRRLEILRDIAGDPKGDQIQRTVEKAAPFVSRHLNNVENPGELELF